MLVSRKILSQYVDLHDISDDQIAHTLTFAGIEVEDFAPLSRWLILSDWTNQESSRCSRQ